MKGSELLSAMEGGKWKKTAVAKLFKVSRQTLYTMLDSDSVPEAYIKIAKAEGIIKESAKTETGLPNPSIELLNQMVQMQAEVIKNLNEQFQETLKDLNLYRSIVEKAHKEGSLNLTPIKSKTSKST